jgi:hypothetical protein
MQIIEEVRGLRHPTLCRISLSLIFEYLMRESTSATRAVVLLLESWEGETALCSETFEPHAFKVFLLEPRSLFNINLLGEEVEICDHGPMVREGAFLDTPERLLLNLWILVIFNLPENSVTPGRHSLLFACVIDLRASIIFIGWSKIDGPFRIVYEELVLEFRAWNHFHCHILLGIFSERLDEFIVLF